MSTKEQDLAMLDKAIETLGEHFDSVQLFVSRYEDGDTGTVSVQKGIGNWFSRYGQVKAWVTRCDEEERENVRREE